MKSASHMLDTIQRTHTGGAGLTLHVSHPAYTNDAGRIALRDEDRPSARCMHDSDTFGCAATLLFAVTVLGALGWWLNR